MEIIVPRSFSEKKISERLMPRICLAAWISYLVFSILWDVGESWPKKPAGTYDLTSYEKVIEAPARNFPGYFFTALDRVRSCVNPVFHYSRRAFLSATVFFLIVLTLSAYCAAAWSGAEEKGAFLAAVFVSSSPFVVSASRVYDVHMPRLASIGAVLALLLYFRKSPSIRHGILLFLVFLLAVFVNSSASEYLFFGLALAAPMAVVFLTAFTAKENRKHYIATGALLVAVIAVASPFIINSAPYPGWLPGNARIFGNGFSALFYHTKSVWAAPAALLAYPYVLWRATLSWPLNMTFALGFILLLFRRNAMRSFWLLSTIIPLLLLILLPKRNIYYVSNIVPALGLCAAAGYGPIIRRLGRYGLVIIFISAVAYNLAVVNQWIPSGVVGDKWLTHFVPGGPKYVPRCDLLGLEGFGTRVHNEDLLDHVLYSKVMDSVPRPAALAFVGNPCEQDLTVATLAFQSIYSRDLICSTVPAPSLPQYDAIVIFPLLKGIPGLYASRTLMEAYNSLERAVAINHPRSAHLYPDDQRLNEKNQRFLAMLHRAKPEFERLSGQFTQVEIIQDFLLFVEPSKVHLFR